MLSIFILLPFLQDFPESDGWKGREHDIEVAAEFDCIRPGSCVQVAPGIAKPSGGWAGVSHSSIGVVRSISYDGGIVEVDFSSYNGWKCKLVELVLAASPHKRLGVGDRVTVTADYKNHGDAAGGPLVPGQVGVIVQDDQSGKPFQVTHGTTKWWYAEQALQKCEESQDDGELGDGKLPTLQMRVFHKEFGSGTLIGWRQLRGGNLRIGDTSGGLASTGCARVQFDGPKGKWNLMLTELTAARPFAVGDRVTVTAGYRNIEDAGDGPLTPGLVGVIVQDDQSSKPFEVQYGDRRWWYVAKALQKGDTTIVGTAAAGTQPPAAKSNDPQSDQVALRSCFCHSQDVGLSLAGPARMHRLRRPCWRCFRTCLFRRRSLCWPLAVRSIWSLAPQHSSDHRTQCCADDLAFACR